MIAFRRASCRLCAARGRIIKRASGTPSAGAALNAGRNTPIRLAGHRSSRTPHLRIATRSFSTDGGGGGAPTPQKPTDKIRANRDMSGQLLQREKSRPPKQMLPMMVIMGLFGVVTLWFGARQLLENPDVSYSRRDRRLALRDNRDEGERYAAHRGDRGVGGGSARERQRRLRDVSVGGVWAQKLGLGDGGDGARGTEDGEQAARGEGPTPDDGKAAP